MLLTQLRTDRFASLELAAGDCDMRTTCRKGTGDGKSQAAAAARDQSDLVGEVKEIVHEAR
jgi:hypothetical protein